MNDTETPRIVRAAPGETYLQLVIGEDNIEWVSP